MTGQAVDDWSSRIAGVHLQQEADGLAALDLDRFTIDHLLHTGNGGQSQLAFRQDGGRPECVMSGNALSGLSNVDTVGIDRHGGASGSGQVDLDGALPGSGSTARQGDQHCGVHTVHLGGGDPRYPGDSRCGRGARVDHHGIADGQGAHVIGSVGDLCRHGIAAAIDKRAQGP